MGLPLSEPPAPGTYTWPSNFGLYPQAARLPRQPAAPSRQNCLPPLEPGRRFQLDTRLFSVLELSIDVQCL
jgi:hypothetical protein